MRLISFRFQQDNDTKHRSKIAKNHFAFKNIDLIPWLPQSPNLNPIEATWDIMKPKVDKINTKNIKSLKKYLLMECLPDRLPRIESKDEN
jgi:transposase